MANGLEILSAVITAISYEIQLPLANAINTINDAGGTITHMSTSQSTTSGGQIIVVIVIIYTKPVNTRQ